MIPRLRCEGLGSSSPDIEGKGVNFHDINLRDQVKELYSRDESLGGCEVWIIGLSVLVKCAFCAVDFFFLSGIVERVGGRCSLQ